VYVSQVGGTIRAVGAMVSHVSPGGVLPDVMLAHSWGFSGRSVGAKSGPRACSIDVPALMAHI
jgi:hypothetical protein